MRVLDDQKRRSAGAVRLALITLCACLLGFIDLTEAGGQSTLTQSHAVAVKSEPPGATIWKKDGRDFTCTNALTPGSVDLTFHGEMDVQRLKLRRFGYAPKVLDVKSSDKELNAELDPKYYENSFQVADDAPSDRKQLNDALKKEFDKTLFIDQEAFRCAPFDLYFIHLTNDKETGAPILNVALRLERSFGGPAFRLAGHAANSQERHQKMGQIALENGMGEVLARFHRVAAKFPELKVITVLGFYATTEAVIETQRTMSTAAVQYVEYEGGHAVLKFGPQVRWIDSTFVKDQDVEKAITLVMPAAQIPDTLDQKAISDAVLSAGKVILAGNIDESDLSAAVGKGSLAGGGSGGDINQAAGAGDLNRVQTLLKAHPELITSKDVGGDTPLHNAVAGNAGKDLVEFLLANNADVNIRDAYGSTPLHLAAYLGHESMVQSLLEHKADINARNTHGETALLVTALTGTPTMVELLLTHGANVNVRDALGRTPLHYAAIGGRPQIVQLFLAHGADANAKDLKGVTPLAFMTSSKVKIKTPQQKEIVALLRQAESSQPHTTAQTEIHEAAALPPESGSAPSQGSGEVEIQRAAAARDLNKLKALLKDNPSLISSKEPENGYTPLHTVVIRGGVTAVVEFLLASGADVNAKDNGGWTPLRYAVNLGDEGVAELLLSHHADIDARDDHKGTALHTVALFAPEGMVEFLLANKADVNAKDDLGRTPLHYAAAFGKPETVRELLEHKADVNAKDNNGITPLTMAVNKGQTEIAGVLRQHGAGQPEKSTGHSEIYDDAANGDLKKVQALLKIHPELISSKDPESGFTPLHAAADSGHKDVAEFLLASKAEVNAKDSKGRTPFEYAAVQRHTDVAELLLAHKADINASDNQGKTTLHAAAFFGLKDVTEFLLAHNADINAKDQAARTPLYNAASEGHKEVAEVLLAHNADVNAKSDKGVSPLDVAKAKGHNDIAELLRQHGGH